MTRAHRNYCLECEWSASERELSRGALAMAAIEHAVETGHDIDSDRVRADGHDRHDGYDLGQNGQNGQNGHNSHDHYSGSDGDDSETIVLFWDE